MSYFDRKMMIFTGRQDLTPRRSEARLKTYHSATDLRVWCDTVDDRRRHILELMVKNMDRCNLNRIPLGAVLKQLQKFGGDGVNIGVKSQGRKGKNGVKLSEPIRAKTNGAKPETKEGYQTNGAKPETKEGYQTNGAKPETKEGYQTNGAKPETKEGYEQSSAEISKEIKEEAGPSDNEDGTRTQSSPTTDSGIKSAEKSSKKTYDKHIITFDQLRAAGVDVDGLKPACWKSDKIEGPIKMSIKAKLDKRDTNNSKGNDDNKPKGGSKGVNGSSSDASDEEVFYESESDISSKSPNCGDDKCPVVRRHDSSRKRSKSEECDRCLGKYNEEHRKRGKSEETALDSQKSDKIVAREGLEKQNAALKTLTKERDDLKSRLTKCQEQLEQFRSIQTSFAFVPQSCEAEIKDLEAEIQIMRKGLPSPEQEADIIQREVEILRRYCSKLAKVEEENKSLRQLKERHQQTENGDLSYPHQIDELKEKLRNLEQITLERDMYKAKVDELSLSFSSMQSNNDSVDALDTRCQILDKVLIERDELQRKLDDLQDVEDKIKHLQQKADRVDELEKELEHHNRNGKHVDMEVRRSKTKCSVLERELKNVKSEREVMEKRISCMQKENCNYKALLNENKILKLERDKLQIKLNELSQVQQEYEEALPKLCSFENIKSERDVYKTKCELLGNIECECNELRCQVEQARKFCMERDSLVQQVEQLESCICDQEEEIKSLVTQIDCLSKNRENKQDRIKEAFAVMQAEIKRKDSIIAESEKKLLAFQEKMTNESCEAACLKSRIEQLELELQQKTTKESTNSYYADTIVLMKQELDSAREENRKLHEIAKEMMSLTGDEHAHKLLKQSESAVKRVVEELGKQYQQWDKIQTIPKKHRSKSLKRKCGEKNLEVIKECHCTTDLKQELDEVKVENDKLQQYVKQLHGHCPGKMAEKELNSLRHENAKLQTQMRAMKDNDPKIS